MFFVFFANPPLVLEWPSCLAWAKSLIFVFFGTVDVMLVSNSVVDAVAACWCAPPLRIGMSDVEPNIVELMTEINYTRSVTRSWIRVLLSEEARRADTDLCDSPFDPLPWHTARTIEDFLSDDTKPVVVNRRFNGLACGETFISATVPLQLCTGGISLLASRCGGASVPRESFVRYGASSIQEVAHG